MIYSNRNVKAWTIAIARVGFEKPQKGFKTRPVLVVHVDWKTGIAQVLKITSNGNLHGFPIAKIANWQELGLRKPSWLQLSPAFSVKISDIGNNPISSAPESLVGMVMDYNFITPSCL